MRIGVEVEYYNPLITAGLEEDDRGLQLIKEPGQISHGCNWFKALMDDYNFFIEPEKGGAKLIDVDGVTHNLTGPISAALHNRLEQGANLLSAKVIYHEYAFKLDALGFRISGLKVSAKGDHWREKLENRHELIEDLFSYLDTHAGEWAGDQFTVTSSAPQAKVHNFPTKPDRDEPDHDQPGNDPGEPAPSIFEEPEPAAPT